MSKKKEARRAKQQEAQVELASKPSVKMHFKVDQFFVTEDPATQTTPLYLAGKIYDIPAAKVDRWIKRGGVIVGQEPVVEGESEEQVESSEESNEDETTEQPEANSEIDAEAESQDQAE